MANSFYCKCVKLVNKGFQYFKIRALDSWSTGIMVSVKEYSRLSHLSLTRFSLVIYAPVKPRNPLPGGFGVLAGDFSGSRVPLLSRYEGFR